MTYMKESPLNQDQLKATLLNLLSKSIEKELETALRAANQARIGSTHRDAEAKSKYETQATELSYLANGQTLRAKDLHQQLSLVRNYKPRYFKSDATVDIGAIVCTETESMQLKYYFIVPLSGGLSFSIDDKNYQILSATAPLAKQLLGRYIGEEIDFMESTIIDFF